MEPEHIEEIPVENEAVESAELEESDTSIEDPGAEQAEADDSQSPETKRPSRGVQKRIDELVREREEWKRAALQGGAGQGQQPQPAPEPVIPDSFPDLKKPNSDSFETYDEYVEALADYRAEVKFRQNEYRLNRQRWEAKRDSLFEVGEEKYGDFTEVFNSATCTQEMADIILARPNGVDLAYYLGKNVKESRRIARLSPLEQVYELGRIEASLNSQPPPQRNQTKAPPAITPVGGKETPAKKPEDMTYEEYKAWRQGGGGK